jgi:hypothetical protein
MTGVSRGSLAGATLVWKRYRAPSPEWDHEHCEFCWAKFAEAEIGDDLLQGGYGARATSPEGHDDYYWICDQCADDLCGRFNWIIIGGPHTNATSES